MRTLVRIIQAVIAVLAVNCGIYGDDAADQVFDRIVENWRWSRFWSGTTGIDDVYIEGKKFAALVFWTKNDSRPIRGLCSTELLACVAYSGVYLDPRARRMPITSNATPEQAFTSFV